MRKSDNSDSRGIACFPYLLHRILFFNHVRELYTLRTEICAQNGIFLGMFSFPHTSQSDQKSAILQLFFDAQSANFLYIVIRYSYET